MHWCAASCEAKGALSDGRSSGCYRHGSGGNCDDFARGGPGAANGFGGWAGDKHFAGGDSGTRADAYVHSEDPGDARCDVHFSAVAGDGIKQDGSGNLELDINGIANAETSIADADLLAIYEQDNSRIEKITVANFKAGLSTENVKHEAHLITSGESTAGYFTLSQTPLRTLNQELST